MVRPVLPQKEVEVPVVRELQGKHCESHSSHEDVRNKIPPGGGGPVGFP
jgi:hypothetical protein